MTSASVIVIGAGLSGLSAARKLHEDGKSVIVLESRDRVGGKTLSITTKNGGIIELGAAWINENTHPEMAKLAREADNEWFEQNIDGNAVFVGLDGRRHMVNDKTRGGPPFADEEDNKSITAVVSKMFPLFDTANLEDVSQTPEADEFDSHSVDSWAAKEGATSTVRARLSCICAGLFGSTSKQISMLYFLHYFKSCGGWASLLSGDNHGAQYQRTRKGNQSMSTYLAACLPVDSVRLGQPVSGITRKDGGPTVVTTRDGSTFTAQAVILALPPALYDVIRFEPPLPHPQRQAVDRAFVGPYSKCVLVYDSPWWYKAGYSGLGQKVADGYVGLVLDTSDGIYAEGLDVRGMAPRQYSLTCFITADAGVRWAALDDDAKRLEIAQKEVGLIFDNTALASKTIEAYHFQWVNEEWSRGAPVSLYGTGTASVMSKQGIPVDGLFFAGTDNSRVWKGYMEGAVLAGHQAASDALAFIDGTGASIASN